MVVAGKGKKFSKTRSSKTLKICNAYGTYMVATQLEIVTSLLIDAQERTTSLRRKKTTRKKKKTTKETMVSRNQKGPWQ